MKTLTKQELVDMIIAIKKATPVTIETETKPKTRKAFEQVIKRSCVNGMINYIYENSVNKQREREGIEADFVADPRAWGQHETKAIISHKDKLYLSIKVQKCQEPEYFSGGQRLQAAVAKQMMYKVSESSRQGVENEVIPRNYMIENIRRITINGETYDIVNV